MIKGLKIDINSNLFDKMKTDFNTALRQTLATMQSHGCNAAKLTLNVGVSLEDSMVADTSITTHDAEREVTIPTFTHKVTSTIQIKDERTGDTGGRGFELVFDNNTKIFYMVSTKEMNGQISLFEDEADFPTIGEGQEEDE